MTGRAWEGSTSPVWIQRSSRRSLTSSLLFSPAVPTNAKPGTPPDWNGFYLLLYRDVEEGWKLERIRRDSSDAQFAPVFAARNKAVEEIKKRPGNDLGDN